MGEGTFLTFSTSSQSTSFQQATSKYDTPRKENVDDDLTEITYNINKSSHSSARKNKRDKKKEKHSLDSIVDEEPISTSTSSTLNISSLSENQVMKNGDVYPSIHAQPRSRSPSKPRSPRSPKSPSAQVALENTLKQIDNEMSANGVEQETNGTDTSSLTTTIDPLDFYNMTREQSPPKKSSILPLKHEETHETYRQPFNRSSRSASPIKNSTSIDQSFLPPLPMPGYPAPVQSQFSDSANINDVQSMIRNELKRIVQIQHDTVMNFLNNGQPVNQHPAHLPYLNQEPVSNLDQQLMTVLRQQKLQTSQNGMPVEFVIETKIKTVSSNGRAVNHDVHIPEQADEENQFMKTFEIPIQESQSYGKSRFINIPLLNMSKKPDLEQQQQLHGQQTKSESSHTTHRHSSKKITHTKITHISKHQKHQQKEHDEKKRHVLDGLQLLGFKSQQQAHKPASKFGHLLHLSDDLSSSRTEGSSTTRVVNKYVKQFMENTSKKSSVTTTSIKNYQLLKLNSLNEDQDSNVNSARKVSGRVDERLEKQLFEEKKREKTPTPPIPRTPTPTALPQPAVSTPSPNPETVPAEDEQPQKDAPTPKVVENPSKLSQVAKPLYDGFIFAPGLFEELLRLNNANEEVSASSAQAHFRSTQYIRDALAGVSDVATRTKQKKDTFTMTDASTTNGAHPLPPNILLKLKFDDMKAERDTNDQSVGKDFVNVADLDSNDVDDLWKLIEHEQSKRAQQNKKTVIDRKEQQVSEPKNELASDELNDFANISRQQNTSSRHEKSILVESKLER
jgi:hypothetical protein